MEYIGNQDRFYINDEQKVRVPLSSRARLIMKEDMDFFGETKPAAFINCVFQNFRTEAQASVELYLEEKRLELDRIFTNGLLESPAKEKAIEILLNHEKSEIDKKRHEHLDKKSDGKLYHINDNNTAYLLEDCEEYKHYKRPGQYIRAVMEEYCSLPFIERERIFKKKTYDIVNKACLERRVLKIKIGRGESEKIFHVYPYKIVSDPFHTQSYLVCYSIRRDTDETKEERCVASFNMARLPEPTLLTRKFSLTKKEIQELDSLIEKYSAAYLIGKPEQIHVRLTENGKRIYQSRLHLRPEKIQELSTDDIYVFDCPELQALHFFLSFGADAEILAPESLREKFRKTYVDASNLYEGIDSAQS